MAIRSWHPCSCFAPTLFLYINHNYDQINILAGHFLRTTSSQIGYFFWIFLFASCTSSLFFRRLFSTSILLLCATFRHATGSGYIRHYFHLLLLYIFLLRASFLTDKISSMSRPQKPKSFRAPITCTRKFSDTFLRLFKSRFHKLFLWRFTNHKSFMEHLDYSIANFDSLENFWCVQESFNNFSWYIFWIKILIIK